MTGNDYSILIVPALCILVFLLKYLVQRLYHYHSEKLEIQRQENINRILGNSPLAYYSVTNIESIEQIQIQDTSPPPDYDTAQRTSSSVISHIIIEDPPPSYEECTKITKTGEISTI